MELIYKNNNDVSYSDYNAKTNITRIIDVCEKNNNDFILRCYNKQMNENGEFDAMGITFSEIAMIMKEVGYECG